jgi:hypothetical protein
MTHATTSGGSVSSSSGRGGHGGSTISSHNRITPTLVALIVVFIICVGPSGILDFFRQLVVFRADGSSYGYYSYQTTAIVTNCLFLINFAVNFVLYCVVNVQFRRTARDIMCCAWRSAGGHRSGRGSAIGNGEGRGLRGRGGYECSLGPSGVIGGRARNSLSSTVYTTALGSTSRFDSVYMHATACASATAGRSSTGPATARGSSMTGGVQSISANAAACADKTAASNLAVVTELETEM